MWSGLTQPLSGVCSFTREIDKVIKTPVVLFWEASVRQGVIIVAEELELFPTSSKSLTLQGSPPVDGQ